MDLVLRHREARRQLPRDAADRLDEKKQNMRCFTVNDASLVFHPMIVIIPNPVCATGCDIVCRSEVLGSWGGARRVRRMSRCGKSG